LIRQNHEIHRSTASGVFKWRSHWRYSVISVVICITVKTLTSTVFLLLVAGCGSPADDPSPLNVAKQSQPCDTTSSPKIDNEPFTLLSEPPDANLDAIATELRAVAADSEFQSHLKQRFASTKLDGQRVVELLEIACYADVQCHAVEYPLRIATLDYVRDNLDAPDVRSAVKWIATSYDSRLPIDAPGDTEGQFRGMLVQGMKIRMTEYARQLLKHHAPSDKSK